MFATCLAIAAADPKPHLLAQPSAYTYGSAPLLAAPIAQPALLQTGYSHVTGQSVVHSALASPVAQLTYAAATPLAAAPAPIAPIAAAVAPALTYAAAPAFVPYQQATFFRQAAVAPAVPVAQAVPAQDAQVSAVPVTAALRVAPAAPAAVNQAPVSAAYRVSRPFINVNPSINVAQVPVTIALRGPRPVAPARLTAAVPVTAAVRVAGPPAPARLTAVRPVQAARLVAVRAPAARYTAPRLRARPAAPAPPAPARLTATPHTVYGVPQRG